MIQPETTLWKTVNALHISAIPNHLANKLHGIDFTRAFWGGRLRADPVTEINPHGNFTETCSYQINDKIIDYLGTSLFLTMQPGEVKRTVSVCLNYYLHSSCRLHEIVSDYTIAKNKTLFTESRQYSMSQYVPTENGISICVEELKLEYKWYKSVLDAQRYIPEQQLAYYVTLQLL